VKLYSVKSFFVEVFYNSEEMKIERVEVVEGSGLNKFLAAINLT
jgi:hypothetical protein